MDHYSENISVFRKAMCYKKPYIIILAFILILTSLNSCRTEHTATLTDVYQYINTDPDSAYRALSAMDITDFRKEKDKALYALLLTRAKHNLNMFYADSIMEYAENYYRSHGSDMEKCWILYCVGNSFSTKENFSSAINYYSEAEIYANNTNDRYMISALNNALGYCYLFQSDYEEALEHFSKSANTLMDLDRMDQYLIPKCQESSVLNILGRHDEALVAAYEAMVIAKKLSDTTNILRISCTIAATKMEMQEYTPSQVKSELFDIYSEYNHGLIPRSHENVVGTIYFHCDMPDSAKIHFQKSLSYDPPIRTRLGIYNIYAEIARQEGKLSDCIEYQKEFITLQDSLYTSTKKSLVQAAEKKYLTDYLTSSYELLQTRHRYQQLITIMLIIILITAIIFIYIFYNRKLKQEKAKIEEALNFAENLQTGYHEIEEKYHRLLEEAGHKSDESQKMTQLLGKRIESLRRLTELASIYESRPNQFYQHFKEHIKVNPQTNVKWEEEIVSITNLFTENLIEDLRSAYPDLSIHELCYCSLLCLGFSQQAIRILYDHTNINSIYSLRTRIRSKLGIIDSGKSLDTFFKEKLKGKGLSQED